LTITKRLFKNWLAFKKYAIFKNILILRIRINKDKKGKLETKQKMVVGPVQTDDAADRDELRA
jgi:hypothetical protein